MGGDKLGLFLQVVSRQLAHGDAGLTGSCIEAAVPVLSIIVLPNQSLELAPVVEQISFIQVTIES